MPNKKRILTLDDLVSFCKSGNLARFNSAESGYKLSVQTPALFVYSSTPSDESYEFGDDSILYGTVKVFHTGENRNGSFVPEKAAAKAMKTISYKPVLAYINCFDEETDDYDFTSHEMAVDEKGELEYIESQVGCFTADAPYMKYDEENEKNFIYARAAIPRTYTKAAEIIEKKGGTKVSVELSINSMSWNSDDDVLSLDDFIVEGCTLLGRSIDYDYGSQVEEGMQGAKFIIDDFKEDNNSIVKFSELNENSKLIETLEKLNDTLSNLSINNIARKEEALMDNENQVKDTVLDNEDAQEKTEKDHGAEFENGIDGNDSINTNDVVNNNPENTEDNTTEPVAEVNENEQNNSQNERNNQEEPQAENEVKPDATADTDTKEEGEEGEVAEYSDTDEVLPNAKKKPEEEDDDDFIATISMSIDSKPVKVEYSISHDDIRFSLYNLMYNAYPEEPLFIASVYDDHFIMNDWNTNAFWSQQYTHENNTVSLSGERVRVYTEFVTQAELDALNMMRNTYPVMEEELSKYKLAEAHTEKETKVQNNSDYELIKDTEEFKSLMEHMDDYSLEDLTTQADLILAKYAKQMKSFSLVENKENKVVSRIITMNSGIDETEKKKPYGGIFEDYFKRQKAKSNRKK